MSERVDKEFEELKTKVDDKVDAEIFDQEIEELKALIQALGSGKKVEIKPSSGVNTKDMNKLKSLAEKIPSLEALIKKLTERMNSAETDIKDIYEILAKKADISDLNDLMKKIMGLEEQLSQLINQVNSIKPTKQPTTEPKNTGADYDKILSALEGKLDRLQSSLTDRLKRVEHKTGVHEKDIADLKDAKAKHHTSLIQVFQRLDMIEAKLNDLDKGGS